MYSHQQQQIYSSLRFSSEKSTRMNNDNQKQNPTSKKTTKTLEKYLSDSDYHLNPDEHLNLRKYKNILNEAADRKLNLNIFHNEDRTHLLPASIRKITFQIAFELEKERLPAEEDLKDFINSIEKSDSEFDENNQKTISFNQLMNCRKQIHKRVFNFLSPALLFRAHFTELPPHPSFRISIETIREFLLLKSAFSRNRINMAKYDENSVGALTKEQFSLYYRTEVMPIVDVLKDLEETFEICYMNTVESMFFFFLDQKHTGRIRIADAIASGFLENAFGLQANCEDYENWFSPEKTHELNALFQMYDSKQKNYLVKEDFKRVQNGSFTTAFIGRLFETHVTRHGEMMSYEEFVIFQIAYSHLGHPASLAYFFKVIDVNDDGYISRYEFYYFYNELRLAYNGWFGGAMPEFDDFADQFFDMVRPSTNGRITLRELVNCKQGHDFVLCLISHTEFYRYETRESENGSTLDQDSEILSLCEEDLPSEIEDNLDQ